MSYYIMKLLFKRYVTGNALLTCQVPPLSRSVSEEERALALGLQFVLYRLIAYIPAPIMFGSVIDSTCLMWTSSCGAGRCLMYDIEQFRFRSVVGPRLEYTAGHWL